MWNPRRVAILAYTSTGESRDTAAIGYIPFPDMPDVSLMDVAARHRPQSLYGSKSSPEGCWLACLGYSSRTVLKPGSIDHPEAAWAMQPDASADIGGMYGYGKVVVGRFTFDDPALMEQARSVLWDGDVPKMSAEDKPAHV